MTSENIPMLHEELHDQCHPHPMLPATEEPCLRPRCSAFRAQLSGKECWPHHLGASPMETLSKPSQARMSCRPVMSGRDPGSAELFTTVSQGRGRKLLQSRRQVYRSSFVVDDSEERHPLSLSANVQRPSRASAPTMFPSLRNLSISIVPSVINSISPRSPGMDTRTI